MPTKLAWTSSACSHIGKVRKINEDAYLDKPHAGLWVVADGMGGHAAGDQASRSIVAALGGVSPAPALGVFVDRVCDCLQRVNQELIAMGAEKHRITGSTVVALLALGPGCAILWAGDSRAYLLRDGALKQLTADHSQIDLYVKLGLIARDQAANHPLSNIVTRAVGTHEALDLDRDTIEARAGDRFLLCSDGLYRHLTHEEIASRLRTGSASSAAQSLVELTLERGALDNVTVVLIDVADGRRAEDSAPNLDDTQPRLSMSDDAGKAFR
ncbi:MAG: protein phosphatase 2C domain-containing protein [Pseudomonadota bacterium]|nr:protein phosphatase 2C domain-containing protein [Pseudomonadota bacterium]